MAITDGDGDAARAFVGAAHPHTDAVRDIWHRREPRLLPIPNEVRGFRIRIDLQRTKPPVWRRIEVPSDIQLPRLHDVIQAAMGWTDSHLHCFRTSNERNPPAFLTRFDLEEGDEGTLEDDVRLDQVVADTGDRLWYDYDFGDGWEHLLRVETVLDEPPVAPICTAGRLACPPEDCGGTWGYADIATWVRADYDDALRPEVFESAAEGREWLPEGWHPDMFDLDEINELISVVGADPVPVVAELASLLELARDRGARGLRDTLAHPSLSGPTEVTDDDAVRLTQPFHALLDVVGGGSALTGAGYLKPSAVEQLAHDTGISAWWIGKANREDLTWPIAELRALAQALGIVSVRKGRIAPTRAMTQPARTPHGILQQISSRLPLGKTDAERHAGWIALAVVSSDTPAEWWEENISDLLFQLGWRDRTAPFGLPSAESPTLGVLRLLAGAMRGNTRSRGVDAAVAAVARATVRG